MGGLSANPSLVSAAPEVNPFNDQETPWILTFADTITKYLNYLMRRSPEFTAIMSTSEKIEALVRFCPLFYLLLLNISRVCGPFLCSFFVLLA